MDNIWCRWCGGKIAIPEFMSCGVGECGINDLSELTYGLVRTDLWTGQTTTPSRTDQMTDQMTTTVMKAVSTFYTSSSSGSFVPPDHVA